MERNLNESTEIFIHSDHNSVGLYPYPFNLVQMDKESTNWRVGVDRFRFGTLKGTICHLRNPVHPVMKDARINPSIEGPITGWGTLSPTLAPMILINALPGYWLNRFRLSRHTSALAGRELNTVDLTKVLEARRKDREQLIQHSHSLLCKLWSLRYHRSIFRQHVLDAKNFRNEKEYPLICAGAEFIAHEGCFYSTLEELARIIHILKRISTGEELPKSFHDLHNRRSKCDVRLNQILENANWYSEFRRRRANTTHAFGTMIGLREEQNDVYLYQHRDTAIFDLTSPQSFVSEGVAENFELECNEFDIFLYQLSIYILSLFHPWDIVTINQRSPGERSTNTVTVWTSSLIFDESAKHHDEGWALMDSNGEIAAQTTQFDIVKRRDPEGKGT